MSAASSALFEQPFTVADRPVRLGASVGVALYPRDALGAEQLLAQADGAMYLAKRARGGRTSAGRRPATTVVSGAARHAEDPWGSPVG